jgi:HSP20 family protein
MLAMKVVQWSPLADLSSLQRQMDRLFDVYTEDREYPAFTPAAEMITTDRTISLYIEIPGVAPDQIDVQVAAKTVTVSGERLTTDHENITGKRSELRYGKFHRVIALPEQVQNDQVTAKYEHGILQLVLPKLVEDKDKIVKVEVN